MYSAAWHASDEWSFPTRRSARLPPEHRAKLNRGARNPPASWSAGTGRGHPRISGRPPFRPWGPRNAGSLPPFPLAASRGPGNQEQPGRQHDSNSRFHGFPSRIKGRILLREPSTASGSPTRRRPNWSHPHQATSSLSNTIAASTTRGGRLRSAGVPRCWPSAGQWPWIRYRFLLCLLNNRSLNSTPPTLLSGPHIQHYAPKFRMCERDCLMVLPVHPGLIRRLWIDEVNINP